MWTVKIVNYQTGVIQVNSDDLVIAVDRRYIYFAVKGEITGLFNRITKRWNTSNPPDRWDETMFRVVDKAIDLLIKGPQQL